MNETTVLVISDAADFSRSVVSRWQTERSVPAFTVMSSQLFAGASTAPYGLAIIGDVDFDKLTDVLGAVNAMRPVIFVATDATVAKKVREEHPRMLVLRRHEGWLDALILLASESLRRVEALTRAERAEQKCQALERDATLGRYMLEMRHSFNNALTSVLGNAELLLLEPGTMPAEMRDQVNTMHTMTLRIHEMVQRFSSLEMEMNTVDKRSHVETKTVSRRFSAES